MFVVDRGSSAPIYKQIEAAFEKRILNNEIPYGSRLPSERKLAELLDVHRNTVIKAYRHLIDKELISNDFQGRRGYYSIFRHRPPSESAMQKGGRDALRYGSGPSVHEKLFSDIFKTSFDEKVLSFGGHVIPETLIMLDEIKTVLNQVVEQYGAEAFSYCSSRGNPVLRRQLGLSLLKEGIKANPGEIVIVNDTPQGLDYLTGILTEAGDCMVLEYPVMPETCKMFREHGLRVLTVSQEADGVNLTQLENIFANYRPRFFYTMPDYHAVTGIRMSLEKRHELLELSYRYGVLLIEERWFAGIGFTEEELPSLYALDLHGNVIMLDNVISRFYYGAKIAFIAASSKTAERIGRSVSLAQVHLQNLEQLMFAEYLKAGYHNRQRRRMSEYYREKCRRLESAMQPLLELGGSWQSPEGGLGLWCRLPFGVNDVKLYESLRKRNVVLFPGKLFYPLGAEEGCFMRLSFSNVSDEEIGRGAAVIVDEIKKQIKDRRKQNV